jgi:HSP20 family molecular chaperone IbpA
MEQEENSKISALEHNIKSKGEFSYYYAHGRKFENKDVELGQTVQGPGIITGGDPVLLESSKKEIEIIKELKKFTKLQFIDDDNNVQIRFELPDEIKELIKEDCIDIKYTNKSFDLRVNVPNGDPYLYSVKKLFKTIKPAECKSKLNKGKLILTLRKEDDSEWEKLSA